MPLTSEQVEFLRPFFGMRPDHVLVANIYPAGPGWALCMRAIPAERKAAIVAACKGELKLPRHRSKSTAPKKAKPI